MFNWVPTTGLVFQGVALTSQGAISLMMLKRLQLLIENEPIGECRFVKMVNGNQVTVHGRLTSNETVGDKSIKVSSIKFHVPNLRHFFGSATKYVNEQGQLSSANSRMNFETDDFLIEIDKRVDYGELMDHLKARGGHVILYVGSVTSKRDGFLFDDTQKILSSFSLFLTFLNGRSCSTAIAQGIHDDNVIWTDYSLRSHQPYQYVHSWVPKKEPPEVLLLWSKFYKLFLDARGNELLNTAIHWYVEANCLAGKVEGAIIMTQTALELIYNWLIVEDLNLMVGSDATSISASNKVRLVLNQLQLSQAVPDTLSNLSMFIKQSPEIKDGPDCFVRIRNAIVHSQEDKRRTLATVPTSVRFETLQLGLMYVELALLYILEYRGPYFNRCSGARYSGEGEMIVPWVR